MDAVADKALCSIVAAADKALWTMQCAIDGITAFRITLKPEWLNGWGEGKALSLCELFLDSKLITRV